MKNMSIIGSIAGKQMKASFDANVQFGDFLVDNSATSSDNPLALNEVQKFLNENPRGLLESLQPWKKLPFINGSDSEGYWIDQEKFSEYRANFSKAKRLYLISAIILIVMGFLILYYLA